MSQNNVILSTVIKYSNTQTKTVTQLFVLSQHDTIYWSEGRG